MIKKGDTHRQRKREREIRRERERRRKERSLIGVTTTEYHHIMDQVYNILILGIALTPFMNHSKKSKLLIQLSN